MSKRFSNLMVPETRKTTVLEPSASTAARKLPGPASFRLVTSSTLPPRPPVVYIPKPSAPGNAGIKSWSASSLKRRIWNCSFSRGDMRYPRAGFHRPLDCRWSALKVFLRSVRHRIFRRVFPTSLKSRRPCPLQLVGPDRTIADEGTGEDPGPVSIRPSP